VGSEGPEIHAVFCRATTCAGVCSTIWAKIRKQQILCAVFREGIADLASFIAEPELVHTVIEGIQVRHTVEQRSGSRVGLE
jgi:hypothetical protein